MTSIVFVGPTISVDDARQELNAIYLPPAAHGDVYRAALTHPFAIGIVDGLFERVPSVWHKEILWALRDGIHVYGSASMGALRAAELDAFGMVGVGTIFERYRDGSLEDDDEVAVAHAGIDDGFASSSEATVNIRATLEAAEQAGIVSRVTHTALIELAKSCFYADRTWTSLLWKASEQGLDVKELDLLAVWLPDGRVDQKRRDALAMLRLMASKPTGVSPKRVPWFFEHTELWERLRHDAATERNGPGAGLDAERLVDELRLDPASYNMAATAAMLRLVMIQEARRRGASALPADRKAFTREFRWQHQLFEGSDVQRWAGEHGLHPAELERLLEDEVLYRRMQALARPQLRAYLLDHLRLSGQYVGLDRRAREKDDCIENGGFDQLTFADAGVTEESLIRWYFEDRLGRQVPDDLEAWARENGFADGQALRHVLLRERFFVDGREQANDLSEATQRPVIDLYGPDVADPFQLYDELRGSGAHWDKGLEAWLLTEFDDVSTALRDRRLLLPVPAVDSSVPPVFNEVHRELEILTRFRCLVVNHVQGRRHKRLRQAIRGSLTGSVLEQLAPRIRQHSNEVFEMRHKSRQLDVATEFAHPLADAVMGMAIGIPASDLRMFSRWCTDVFLAWPEIVSLPNAADIVRQSFTSMRELNAYLKERVAERWTTPKPDLLGALGAALGRDEVTNAELVANVAFVHESGRHTTGDLISNAVLSLLEHPDQLARVRDDPSLLETCTDELLRYDSPVGVVRVATQDMRLAGASIRAGQPVIPVLNAANRDPKRFSDPGRLDLGMRRAANVGFGAGPHYCLGAALAPVEVSIAIQTLISRCPKLQLGPEPPRMAYHQSTRRLSSLMVSW
jgi:cytochrome P450